MPYLRDIFKYRKLIKYKQATLQDINKADIYNVLFSEYWAFYHFLDFKLIQ